MLRARKFAEHDKASVNFTNPPPAVINVVRIAGLEALLFGKRQPHSSQKDTKDTNR
jgi:hypothetical protein